MTLTTPYSATFIVGDGETKTFSYLFEEVSPNFILVMVYNSVTGLISTPTYVIDTDQKLVIFGDDTPAPTADETVCIYRNTPNVQDVAFRTLHGYDAQTLENILSKIVAMIQEIKSNYFSTQVLQGDPWQLDLLSSADDGATINIDYTAKKLVKGLYFRITSGNLQVSADGSTYITMPKSTDVAEFRQNQIELPDHTYQYKLQYRVGNQWFDAEANAQYKADEAYALAESLQTTMSAHINNTQNPHQTSMDKLTDTDFSDLQNGQFISYVGGKWKNVASSATVSWGGILGDIDDQTDLQDKLYTKFDKTGGAVLGEIDIRRNSSTSSALLTMTNNTANTARIWRFAPSYSTVSLSVYPGSTETNGFRFATTGFVPASNNARYLGSASLKWKGIYVGVINNGADLTVPNKTGTLATMGDVELAARSGRMLTDQGVWYAKMYSSSTVPTGAEYDGRNYADFSQVDQDNNPIIVIYEGQSGAWVQSEIITPPAEYDGYVSITSKIWDIVEQVGQQGGRVLWNHTSKEFTPEPRIISTNDIEITGTSTVIMPLNPSGNQIVNKDYVDNAIPNSGTGRNVGDIFLTMRNDNELNGAVECDGSPYNTTDFTGAQSIGQLLSAGKVPYVSLSAYADEITAKGWCDKFGWDGVGTTAFKVPTLNAYIWQKLNMAVVGNGNNTVYTDGTNDCVFNPYFGSSNNGIFVDKNSSHINVANGTSMGGGTNIAEHLAIGLSTDKTKSNVLTDTTDDICDERVMVQLAISATDEALETCTGVLADIANLQLNKVSKGHEVIEFQAPTAENNYTWYRKYADGWVEQGGITESSSGSTAKNVVFPIEMADTNYTALVTIYGSLPFGGAGNNPGVGNTNTTTGMTIYSGNTGALYWEVKGMAQV